MKNSSGKDFLRFAFGFVAMVSIGFVVLLGVGFYQVEIAGNSVASAISDR